jgi:hypothetical protein
LLGSDARAARFTCSSSDFACSRCERTFGRVMAAHSSGLDGVLPADAPLVPTGLVLDAPELDVLPEEVLLVSFGAEVEPDVPTVLESDPALAVDPEAAP